MLGTMVVPTLPEARYLVLNDADLASLVCVALAAERWGGQGQAPVIVPSWWAPEADLAMPLVNRSSERQAAQYALKSLPEELVVEPADPASGFSELSQLLLAATRLAAQRGCESVLFPIRAADLEDGVSVRTVAREIDRAALVGRLAALDAADGAPVSVVTPLIDLDDEQLIDLARDLSVPFELCWWAGVSGEPAAERAGARWRGVGDMAAGAAASPGEERFARTLRPARTA